MAKKEFHTVFCTTSNHFIFSQIYVCKPRAGREIRDSLRRIDNVGGLQFWWNWSFGTRSGFPPLIEKVHLFTIQPQDTESISYCGVQRMSSISWGKKLLRSLVVWRLRGGQWLWHPLWMSCLMISKHFFRMEVRATGRYSLGLDEADFFKCKDGEQSPVEMRCSSSSAT